MRGTVESVTSERGTICDESLVTVVNVSLMNDVSPGYDLVLSLADDAMVTSEVSRCQGTRKCR